jgi:protein MAK16
MNHDEAVWNIMGQTFCSFKVKTHDDKVRFCRNPYNVTGLCQRGVCPLANGQYATVIEHEDELYLYIKTAERAHLPRRQWEKIKLDVAFPKALEQIDDNLQWWDRRFVNKVKARLLRLKQYLMRRKQALTEPDVEYVSVNKRQEHKLLRREAKAEQAARIELEIEKELLERLKKGTYDSVINYNKEAFEKLLDQEENAEDMERQEELDEEDGDLADFYMSSDDEADADEDEDQPVRKKSRLVIEREYEPATSSKKSSKNADLEW